MPFCSVLWTQKIAHWLPFEERYDNGFVEKFVVSEETVLMFVVCKRASGVVIV